MDTKVMKCSCEHKGQDAIYGKGMRLFNRAKHRTQKDGKAWRCTVCGNKIED